MKEEIRILMIEDVSADVVMINHALREGGLNFRTKRVESREEFVRELEQEPPDVILSDHGLPGFDGFSALAIAKDKCPDVPFIFVTSALGEQLTIETFVSGATDYVLKNRLRGLVPAVQRALGEAEARRRQRETDQALRESEERFRMLVEGVKDYAIVMLDEAGRIDSWNAGAEWMNGYRAAEILGEHFSCFYTPEDLQAHQPQQALRTAAEKGRYEEEGWRVRKSGERFRAHVVITALRDERGELRGFAHVTRNITERLAQQEQIRELNVQLERRVRDRTAELEALNQELEAFNYSVSHDLRTPLRHITGFVKLLEDKAACNLDEEGRHLVRTIADSAKQMGQLIDDLLAFSQMSRAELHKTMVDLNELVKAARQELRDQLEGRKVEWAIGKLPEVYGDPALLQQVMVNLLSNALKYTRSRDAARIEIGANDTTAETVVFIRDNGVGFDMAYLGKLFGVFQRLHPSAQFEGTGIGLANVRRIIQRHGGMTWAEGEINRGVAFYFSLPKPTGGQ